MNGCYGWSFFRFSFGKDNANEPRKQEKQFAIVCKMAFWYVDISKEAVKRAFCVWKGACADKIGT